MEVLRRCGGEDDMHIDIGMTHINVISVVGKLRVLCQNKSNAVLLNALEAFFRSAMTNVRVLLHQDHEEATKRYRFA